MGVKWEPDGLDEIGEEKLHFSQLSNVRRDIYRMFRKKKRDYMKVKVNKLEENSKNKNIQKMYKGINEFINSRLCNKETWCYNCSRYN